MTRSRILTYALGLAFCLPLAMGSASAQNAAPDKSKCAGPGCPDLTDNTYNNFYWGQPKYYMQDELWVKQTMERLKAPKAGERVPDLRFEVRTDQREWVEFGRKHAEDLAKIGIKVDVDNMVQQRQSANQEHHSFGDLMFIRSVARPERVDPSEYLITRFQGDAQNNYQEYSSKAFDGLAQGQLAEGDVAKRRDLINKAQQKVVADEALAIVGWGPALTEAYRKDRVGNVQPNNTFGIAAADLPWNLIDATPLKGQKRINIGTRSLLSIVNPFASGPPLDKGVARLLYDTFAQLDRDLKVVPWAAESWKQIDPKTFEIKLRPGMKFSDGKPVTVEDVKFTTDFLLKYDRGVYWSVNKFLDKAEITDAANGIVRYTFKAPYGQFETQFLLQNRIFPKHIWDGIMERHNETNPANLQLKDEELVGSGLFKWTGFYKKDTELLLAANKSHFRAPKIDEILYVVVPSLDGLLGRLDTGEIDWAADAALTPSQVAQFSKNPGIAVVKSPDTNWLQIPFAMDRLPWRDIEFRRAYMHTIDRKYFNDVLWEGAGREPTSNTYFPPGHPFNDASLPPAEDYSLDKAKEILKNAGYSWDGQGRLVYPPPTDKEYLRRITQVTKDPGDWRGLKLNQ
jgi:peptide/nickel transport system substrate-binding protein